ncbi:MAG: hypothetical protein IIZ33_08200 [Erysipelotrichaceae bacterium]|nr:hypothetical protein [Erysipelotrichaceae bacterium]
MSRKVSFQNMLDSLIPISVLNQGKAAKIISSLQKDEVKIIVKNNEPMAAIVPISRFSELCETEEKWLSEREKENE